MKPIPSFWWHCSAKHILSIAALGCLLLAGCKPGADPMNPEKLEQFALDYTAAWCSGDPARVASFFAEDGTLVVNGSPSVGRTAIAGVAQGFMSAFPDMVLVMDKLEIRPGGVVYHWTFTGTNSGPGGTGNYVDFSGYEEWTIGEDGLVSLSLGHFDEAEYRRQLEFGADNP